LCYIVDEHRLNICRIEDKTALNFAKMLQIGAGVLIMSAVKCVGPAFSAQQIETASEALWDR